MIEYIYIIILHILGAQFMLAVLPKGASLNSRIFIVLFWPLPVGGALVERLFWK